MPGFILKICSAAAWNLSENPYSNALTPALSQRERVQGWFADRFFTSERPKPSKLVFAFLLRPVGSMIEFVSEQHRRQVLQIGWCPQNV